MKRNSDNTSLSKCNGFSLLEITIVLIIISILLSAVIPVLSRSYLEKAANKTALDMASIQDASRKFYIDNNRWPDTIAELQAANTYLPSAWVAQNPFVKYEPDLNDFNYYIASSASSLKVYTNVPLDAQIIIENLLPLASVDPPGNGHHLYSSINVPGDTNILPVGSILAWFGTNAPQGFLLCDGATYNVSPTFQALAAVLNSGNGALTFTVPDLRGRSIVGVMPLSFNHDGSSRIWPNDTYSDNKGQIASYINVSQLGKVLGEEQHRQTVAEMAPHTHDFASWDYVKGFSGNSTTSPRDPQNGTTSPAGGNGDGSGLGAPANIVEPSVALNYIIKY